MISINSGHQKKMESFLRGKNTVIYLEYIYPKGISFKNTGKIKVSLLTTLPWKKF